MTNVPRALLAIDIGAATTSVALLGKPGARWRLLGALSAPAGTPPEAIAEILATRLIAADLALADHVGVTVAGVADLPRLEARSQPPETLAVLGASRRAVGLLEAVAARTPWRILPASPESHDPREMTELALRSDVTAVLVGAGDPPGPDERGWLDDLSGLVGAVARRRPGLRIVLAGPVASRPAWAEGFGGPMDAAADRVFQAPALGVRSGPDEPLREILERLQQDATDTRHMAVRSVLSLADAIDRRLEVVDIGLDGGMRAMASPGIADQGPVAIAVRTARAALVPVEIDDAAVDAVLAWTTGSLDRHRMGDRLQDLRAQPWADASGEGARLRLAAARGALSRLVAHSPDISALASPDVTVIAGGAFAVAPPRAVALAIADTVRRTGATQLAIDHARLLGPIGTIDDPDERRDLIADLADDLLAPIGSLLVVGSAPASRRNAGRAGRLTLDGDRHGRHDLSGGEIAFFDLAPGDRALATLEFRDAVRLGQRAKRVAVPVSGGVAGLAVDLRDVPLRLPERRDRRRATLASWGELPGPVMSGDHPMIATEATAAELTAVQRAGLALVSRRTLVASPLDAFFALRPGDRSLVKAGEAVGRGQPIVEHYRDSRTIVVSSIPHDDGPPAPGERWSEPAGRHQRDGDAEAGGELLFRSGGRWRIAGGDRPDPIESPFAGVVHDVRSGTGVTIRTTSRAILGRAALAGPTWGRLHIAADADGELRAQHVDVGAAGSIIVAGARIDAEALTRARAVGIRGVIVAALGIKEQRDFLASERRGRAAVHGLPPFGILVLDGATRRPIASPVMAMFEAIEGSMVAIVGDPPALVIDDPAATLPLPADGLVRVRSGPLAGAEGTWAGLAGPRRFPAGVTLEAAFVRFGGRPPVAIPIGDLERFA